MERDNELVDVSATHADDAQVVRAREHLDQLGLRFPFDAVDEGFERQDVLHVDRKLIVPVDEQHVAGDAAFCPPLLDERKEIAVGPVLQIDNVPGGEVPGRPAEDRAACRDTRKKRCVLERPPVPCRPALNALMLQRAQELVHAERPQQEVVSAGEAGDDLPVETAGPQDDPAAADRNHQVGHLNLTVFRCP